MSSNKTLLFISLLILVSIALILHGILFKISYTLVLAFFLLLFGLIIHHSQKILFSVVSRACQPYFSPIVYHVESIGPEPYFGPIVYQEESIGPENELLLKLKNKPVSLMKNVILLEYMRRKQNLLGPLALFVNSEKFFLGLSYKDLRKPRKVIEYYEQELKFAQVMLGRQDEGIAFGALGGGI